MVYAKLKRQLGHRSDVKYTMYVIIYKQILRALPFEKLTDYYTQKIIKKKEYRLI